MQKIQIIILSLLVFLFPPSFVFASVVINEIAWMGTNTYHGDEWIELYNAGENEIDVTDWALKAADGSPKISLEGIIPISGYFLLERTDDKSVPDIFANLIYTGALGNSGETLELRDDENNLIDTVNCSDGWPGGDNTTKQTMERNGSSWQTSIDIGGTPKGPNSPRGDAKPKTEPELEPEPQEKVVVETRVTEEPSSLPAQQKVPAAEAMVDKSARQSEITAPPPPSTSESEPLHDDPPPADAGLEQTDNTPLIAPPIAEAEPDTAAPVNQEIIPDTAKPIAQAADEPHAAKSDIVVEQAAPVVEVPEVKPQEDQVVQNLASISSSEKNILIVAVSIIIPISFIVGCLLILLKKKLTLH